MPAVNIMSDIEKQRNGTSFIDAMNVSSILGRPLEVVDAFLGVFFSRIRRMPAERSIRVNDALSLAARGKLVTFSVKA